MRRSKNFKPIWIHQVIDLPDQIGTWSNSFSQQRYGARGPESPGGSAVGERLGFLAQSIAWRSGPGTGPVLDAHEDAVVAAGGTVLRYGLFYGPETFFESEPPPPPRLRVDDAARRTMPFLAGQRGIFTITEDEVTS